MPRRHIYHSAQACKGADLTCRNAGTQAQDIALYALKCGGSCHEGILCRPSASRAFSKMKKAALVAQRGFA
jgi:hypothetical protein